jgi:hypothetical protein
MRTTRVHHAARRRGGGVAARGARAAGMNPRFRLHEGIELAGLLKTLCFHEQGKRINMKVALETVSK